MRAFADSGPIGTPLFKRRLRRTSRAYARRGGFPPDGLANAIRLLRLRMVVFCVPIILAAKLVYQSDEGGAISLAASALLLICACVGLLTTCWRLTVLRFRHFVPFRRWLLSAFSRP